MTETTNGGTAAADNSPVAKALMEKTTNGMTAADANSSVAKSLMENLETDPYDEDQVNNSLYILFII